MKLSAVDTDTVILLANQVLRCPCYSFCVVNQINDCNTKVLLRLLHLARRISACTEFVRRQEKWVVVLSVHVWLLVLHLYSVSLASRFLEESIICVLML